jgi:fructose-specific phosphotransferase system IIC component
LKFSDVILAVATAVVIAFLVDTLLFTVFISSLGSIWALNSAGILSTLIAGLLVGYIFAVIIQEESRMKAVGKIAVLAAFVNLLAALIGYPTNSYYGAWIKEGLQSAYQTGSWTTADWFVHEALATYMNVTVEVVFTLVLGFVGLYVGSMLRKPKKT